MHSSENKTKEKRSKKTFEILKITICVLFGITHKQCKVTLPVPTTMSLSNTAGVPHYILNQYSQNPTTKYLINTLGVPH